MLFLYFDRSGIRIEDGRLYNPIQKWLETGVGGVGELHQIFSSRVQHAKINWTQSDLKFCKNEGSKRSKIMEKIHTKFLKTVK